MNYKNAKEILATARNPSLGKPIDNNTRIMEIEPGIYNVVLHQTAVITFYPDGFIRLDSGGWRTSTTKDRMNKYQDQVWINQDRGIWYVNSRNDRFGKSSLFYDNMIIRDGNPVTPMNPVDDEKLKKKMDRIVRQYIKGYTEHNSHELKKPSLGDCMICQMNGGSKDTHNDVPFHEVFGVDHYLCHFEEKYYPASLLWNAIKEKSYGDPGFVISWMAGSAEFRKSEIPRILGPFFRKRKLALVEELKKR